MFLLGESSRLLLSDLLGCHRFNSADTFISFFLSTFNLWVCNSNAPLLSYADHLIILLLCNVQISRMFRVLTVPRSSCDVLIKGFYQLCEVEHIPKEECSHSITLDIHFDSYCVEGIHL